MARRSPGPPRPPGSYRHERASRVYQPTAETAPLMDDDQRQPKEFTVTRTDTGLPVEQATSDRAAEPMPRLAWDRQGRTSAEDGPHNFAGTPLYTREKINPLTMIDQLRRPDAGVPLNLLDDFNGLPADAQKWEFYQHSGHWQNRLIHGDSAEVMQSLIARDGLAGQVQMIYFDPPYGIKYNSNFMTATDNLETKNDPTGIPMGDTMPIKAFRDTYKNGIHSYLDEIHERLVLFRELLTDSGSLFLQIGDDNVHRLAVLCDEVFGDENRVATITWRTAGTTSSNTLPETSSYILWYSKSIESAKYRSVYEELDRKEIIEHFVSYAMVELDNGEVRKLTKQEKQDPQMLPKGSRIFRAQPLTSAGASNTGRTCSYDYNGHTYHSGHTRQWRVSTPEEQRHATGTKARATGVISPPDGGEEWQCGLDRLAELNRLHGTGENGSLGWKQYEDEVPGRKLNDIWHKTAQLGKSKRYVVQTATSLIERCILMSTDPGDLVLDPTCGSGVTPHIAEQWGRRWIGIDVGRVSIAVARRHLLTAVHPWYRTRDGGSDPAAGLEVETMQRVSAATLAYDKVNDPENTIYLVDRPKKDTKRSRLTGPFTVESASPYAYLPFSENPSAPAADIGAAEGQSAERLLEALVAHPICDASGQEVLSVVETTPWPHSQLVSHEADCTAPGRETRLAAAIVLAASDVTVNADMIAIAAGEARRARRDISDLIIVASAFEDAASTDAGAVRVHKVAASRDLQIPGLGIEPDAGALTLLGEPDVWCERDGQGNLVVELAGYDTYDPSTGRVKQSSGADVDCWMVDTDHDGTGFFPRLVYMPGYKRGDTQIKQLVKSLGKELDKTAEEALCGTVSQPFAPPRPGNNVAVKIITLTGAEMTAVVYPPSESHTT
ncbi:site-specific DNA-methyltransferase [Candidatus Poriferisocius sp.]|uniref:site-specific DNA-methyltransferase n=1 Tax=Candidatus Poriferisocius sp. TaxID=3101276 RepID=UPI003B01DB58